MGEIIISMEKLISTLILVRVTMINLAMLFISLWFRKSNKIILEMLILMTLYSPVIKEITLLVLISLITKIQINNYNNDCYYYFIINIFILRFIILFNN